MTCIFVYGVTAVGKSTWARSLSQERGLTFIDGDDIRYHEWLVSEAGRSDGFAHLTTKTAWQRYGSRTRSTIQKGLAAYRKGINDFLDKKIADKNNFVLEASYLDPARHTNKEDTEVYLLVCKDINDHRRRMFERDNCETNEKNEIRLSDARALQEELLIEAARLGVTVVDVWDLL